MAVKTVDVQSFDAAMAFGTSAQLRKSAESGAQSFGEVLNKAGERVADKSQPAAKNAGQKKPETGTDNAKTQESKEKSEMAEKMQETTNSTDDTKEVVEEGAADAKTVFDEKLNAAEGNEEPDKLTTEQIADALAQIIEQIKELLGISDEELLASMESVGMEPKDLLNADNMAQLLAAVAGEGEAISLVTNEDLYAALQELTATVDEASSKLLEDTGLTPEELDAFMEKLAQMENNALDEPVMTDAVKEDAALETAGQEEVLPVVVEDHTKTQQTKTSEQQTQNQYEELPENRQENMAENSPTTGMGKVQTQKPEHDTHGQEKSDDMGGQHGTVQNFGEKFNETPQVSAQEATSYATETTESILKQLADFVKIIRNENLTQMELQLHPASLGTVNVSLVTKGGAVTAEFTTQNEAVRAAIESQVSQLVTNLEEQGVKVEAVEVSVASHEMERNLEDSSQNDQSRQEQEEQQRVRGVRRNSINFNSFADGDELAEEMQTADDATRIAMELMAANGNSMDLMA